MGKFSACAAYNNLVQQSHDAGMARSNKGMTTMNAQITISGLAFDIQGDGFGRHEADFEQIVQNISDALHDLSEGNLKDLHAGSIFNEDEGEFADRSAFDALNRIAYKASQPVLADWHNTDNVFTSICGVPA
jgi:hypothetical protein